MKRIKRLLMVVAAMNLAAFAAHAQQAGNPPAPGTTADGAKAPDAKKGKKAKAVVLDYTPQASEYGKKVKCPVGGDEFKVGPDTKAVKYKGKTYYFCCSSCMPRFKKNPAKYAK
jgi:YHS domain-containing protein